jgi:hypothetical protein
MNKKELEKKIRNKADKQWREAVLNRDGSLCVICQSTNRINCHHIIPRTIKEFRHNVTNGICLCPKHHKWGTYSAHKHGLWFYNWLMTNRKEQFEYLITNLLFEQASQPIL